MTKRSLGVIKEILESAGMGFNYAYEDLVFLDHSGFLLQFAEKKGEVLIHVNVEAEQDALALDIALLQERASEQNMVFLHGQQYKLREADGENVTLEFL